MLLAKPERSGHWFFNSGSWTACGEMEKGKDGRWHVSLNPNLINRKSCSQAAFATIEEALQYVREYFGLPVRRVKPTEMPAAEDL